MSVRTGSGTTTHETPKGLATFLRTMRARARPAGLTTSARRRTGGLRREEVAVKAGISVTWYTWLEQGRTGAVSPQTLDRIADALNLRGPERAHLLALAASNLSKSRLELTREASESLRLLVSSLAPHPAYAVNGIWDLLCWNKVAGKVFGAFDGKPRITDNVLRRLFLDPDWRTRFEDWDGLATSVVDQFRAATGRLVDDPTWREWVAQLCAESEPFRLRWDRHELAGARAREKTFAHARAGRLRMHYVSLAVDGEAPDVRVILYRPANPITGSKIRRLS